MQAAGSIRRERAAVAAAGPARGAPGRRAPLDFAVMATVTPAITTAATDAHVDGDRVHAVPADAPQREGFAHPLPARVATPSAHATTQTSGRGRAS